MWTSTRILIVGMNNKRILVFMVFMVFMVYQVVLIFWFSRFSRFFWFSRFSRFSKFSRFSRSRMLRSVGGYCRSHGGGLSSAPRQTIRCGVGVGGPTAPGLGSYIITLMHAYMHACVHACGGGSGFTESIRYDQYGGGSGFDMSVFPELCSGGNDFGEGILSEQYGGDSNFSEGIFYEQYAGGSGFCTGVLYEWYGGSSDEFDKLVSSTMNSTNLCFFIRPCTAASFSRRRRSVTPEHMQSPHRLRIVSKVDLYPLKVLMRTLLDNGAVGADGPDRVVSSFSFAGDQVLL